MLTPEIVTSCLAQVRSNTNGINGQNPLKQWLFLASQMLNYSVSYQAFKGFRSRLINETPLYSSLPELEASPPQADIYLTGSDQVWGRMGPMPYDRAYFLDFVPDNAPRVAYSASFGREHIEIDADTLQGLLQKYKEINVREASAVDILNTMGFDYSCAGFSRRKYNELPIENQGKHGCMKRISEHIAGIIKIIE